MTVPLVVDRFSVNVRRLEQNLYRDTNSRAIIEMRHCYEYTYGEDAVPQWEAPFGNNWLLFIESETKCDVIAIRMTEILLTVAS